MARRNTLKLNISGFEELITKLDALEGDVKKAVTDAMTQAAEKVHDDTVEALKTEYLPAHGKYSHGDTKKSVVLEPVTWSGTVASVPVGFDYSMPGAGGFLISGTPRMKPDAKLAKVYKNKKYMDELQDEMQSVVGGYIVQKMEG